MVAIGLALLVLSGVATLGVLLSNTSPLDGASAFGISVAHVSVGGFFVAGAVAGLVFGLGLALMVAGAARRRSKRRETKRTVKSARSEQAVLTAENDRLRQEMSGRNGADDGGDTTTQERQGLFRR